MNQQINEETTKLVKGEFTITCRRCGAVDSVVVMSESATWVEGWYLQCTKCNAFALVAEIEEEDE
jgi:hypothetical protein